MEKERYELLNDSCIYDNELKEYVVNPTLSMRTYLGTLTKLLNQRDTRIKELEKENQKANIKNYLTDYYLVEKENQQLKTIAKELAIEKLELVLNNFKNRPVYFDIARQELCLSDQDKQFIDFINNQIKELKGEGEDE